MYDLDISPGIKTVLFHEHEKLNDQNGSRGSPMK